MSLLITSVPWERTTAGHSGRTSLKFYCYLLPVMEMTFFPAAITLPVKPQALSSSVMFFTYIFFQSSQMILMYTRMNFIIILSNALINTDKK